MDFSHGPIADSSTLIERTGIPRKVLSRLLDSTKVGVGFRVLDVGCGDGDLAAYLNSLGIQLMGIDESPTNVIEARRKVPACEFNCASITDPVGGPRGGFDLVLVREASVFKSSLLSPASVSASLKLLSHVRPAGCLAFLARIDAGTSVVGGHRVSCYSRHLGGLPGVSEHHEFPDGLIFGRPHGAQTPGQVGSGYGIAILRLPPQPLSQEDWKKADDVALNAASEPCCPWASSGARSTGFRYKVA